MINGIYMLKLSPRSRQRPLDAEGPAALISVPASYPDVPHYLS